MALFEQEHKYLIKRDYFKLSDELREKVMFVASVLAGDEQDEEVQDSAIWYFTQKKNHKELEKLYRQYKNEGAVFAYAEERKQRISDARKVTIKKKK